MIESAKVSTHAVRAISQQLRPFHRSPKSLIVRGSRAWCVSREMTSGGRTQSSMRKALGAIKDSTTVNLAKVGNENMNPVWNQTFDFVVEDGLHDMLILEVYGHDTFGKDYMGKCILTLTRVIMEGEFKDSFPLQGAKSGKLNLHLKWIPQPIFRDS